MGTTGVILSHVLIICSISCLVLPYSCNAHELKPCGFNSLYVFGDSLSDIGNSIQEVPQAYHARLPYGRTIHKATGRSSDGLLIVDYIAKSAALPLGDALLNPNATHFSSGVNFAVAGAPILSAEVLAKHNVSMGFIRSSFDVQLGWLDTHLKKSCHNVKDCREKFKSTLFVVWFGGNDYDLAFNQNKTFEQVKKGLVQDVVKSVENGAKKLINYGATRLLVPGLIQLGCTPAYLTIFSRNNSAPLDKHHCLKNHNAFYNYHNKQLQKTLKSLRKEYPNVRIVYGDVYNKMHSVLDNLQHLRFKAATKACCGVGGEHNFANDFNKLCGASGVPVCSDPKRYIFWDGYHFTQQANKNLAKLLIKDILPKFQCSA